MLVATIVVVMGYELLLVPRFLRELCESVCTTLFVPEQWPSSELFRCLPRIVAGLTVHVWCRGEGGVDGDAAQRAHSLPELHLHPPLLVGLSSQPRYRCIWM